MHPSWTATLLLNPVWDGTLFSLRPTLCPGCAQRPNNSCKQAFSYLSFQSWHIPRLNNSHWICYFLAKGRQWESISTELLLVDQGQFCNKKGRFSRNSQGTKSCVSWFFLWKHQLLPVPSTHSYEQNPKS